jgi:hypothetical protein
MDRAGYGASDDDLVVRHLRISPWACLARTFDIASRRRSDPIAATRVQWRASLAPATAFAAANLFECRKKCLPRRPGQEIRKNVEPTRGLATPNDITAIAGFPKGQFQGRKAMLKTRIVAASLALAMGTVLLAGATEAQARPGWGAGLGIGLAAGALLGVAAASSYAPAYVVPAYRCYWQPRYNAFGAYVGSARVCGY